MCNSGVGLTPLVDGKVHNFSAGGLYDGLILLIDDQTRSYWDHITGRALHGPLAGTQLPMWGIEQHTVAALRQSEPELAILLARATWWTRFMSWLTSRWQGKLPPGFRRTMDSTDQRLAEMTMGLGVAEGDGLFVPLTVIPQLQSGGRQSSEGLCLPWRNRQLRVYREAESGIPRAEFEDGSLPPQLFSRWYGFVRAYPHCAVHNQP